MSGASNNRDLWTGVMFLGIGTAALGMARHYPFGSTLRMGPGYFPSVLGGLLVGFGLLLMAKGWRRRVPIEGSWSLRALTVLPLAFTLFGLLIDRAGFVPALAVLVFCSAAAGREFKWGEVLLLTAGLTVFAVALFIWGLGLPYALIKGF
jgi:hypothetical protein